MRNAVAIAKRELQAYFGSPIAYVLFGFFFLIMGWMFMNLVPRFSNLCLRYQAYPAYAKQLNLNRLVLEPLMGNMSVILLLILPILTMRLVAEERSKGTLEMLLTRPVSTTQIVVGKFAAAFVMALLLLLFSGVFPLLLALYGDPDLGPVYTGYVGLVFMSASFVAVGLCASSFTDSQVVAGVTGFFAALFFWIIGWPEIARLLGRFAPVLEHLSLTYHYRLFAKGVLDSTGVVYYASFVAFGLYFSRWILDSQRWR